MSGNYSRYIKKFEEINKASNNYKKLLQHKIDEKETYSNLLRKLDLNLDNEYLDLGQAYGTYWTIGGEDTDFTRKQQLARDMHNYIPQVEPNKTFKENIQKIIN